ncbi:hypothetical protein C1H46_026231 [Malus baccata]|uniref:Di19 C-terminal domain-containing protein n=1 Tax=Malus baccata TaxID=106549 RepID=A0A540LNV1_MALBA|nr:hypothetical protein C1H46_026231 [Malus baccata]
MDSEFWTSRLAAAKRQYTLQHHHQSSHFGADEISKSVVTTNEDSSAKNAVPSHIWKSSFDPSLSYEEREKRIRQATGRAGFMQDLFLSTLLGD